MTAKITGTHKRMLAFLLAVALCVLPGLSLADAGTYLAVRGGKLNLRQEANLSSKVLGQYATGTWALILESGNSFHKVQVDGKTGYMSTKYLTGGSGKAVATRYVRTNTGIGVNLRTSPSASGGIVTGVPDGTKVDVLVKGIGWYKVRVGSQTGYIAAQYLSTGGGGTSQPQRAVVNNPKSTQYLNLRETASQAAKVLGRYKNHTPVTVLQAGNVWCKVQVDGKTGYMMTAFLKMTTASLSAKVNNPNGGRIVNFRSGPSLNASVVKTLAVGTKVAVLEKGTDWSLVEVKGATGYVSTWFLIF